MQDLRTCQTSVLLLIFCTVYYYGIFSILFFLSLEYTLLCSICVYFVIAPYLFSGSLGHSMSRLLWSGIVVRLNVNLIVNGTA